LTLEEFRSAFRDPTEEELKWFSTQNVIDFTELVIPPKPMKELYERDSDKGKKKVEFKKSAVRNFKIKVKEVSHFSKVWSSQGSMSKMNVSVWAGELESSLLKQNRIKICLGHYAHPKFAKPGHKSLFSSSSHSSLLSVDLEKKFTLEIKDTEHWGIGGYGENMLPVLNKIMPHPVRFKQVWSQQHGGSPFYAWKPVPPSPNFVTLGMLATTIDEPPSVTSIRCVPRHWCVKSELSPIKLWQDAGASGGKPGSIWVVNSLRTLVAAEGHGEPQEKFFDLMKTVYILDDKDIDAISSAPKHTTAGGIGGTPVKSAATIAASASASASAPRPRPKGPPPQAPPQRKQHSQTNKIPGQAPSSGPVPYTKNPPPPIPAQRKQKRPPVPSHPPKPGPSFPSHPVQREFSRGQLPSRGPGSTNMTAIPAQRPPVPSHPVLTGSSRGQLPSHGPISKPQGDHPPVPAHPSTPRQMPRKESSSPDRDPLGGKLLK